MRLSYLVAVLSTVLLALGCGGKSDQPKSAAVKGKVILEGVPLATGKIQFDEGAGVPVAEMDIKDGVYAGSVTVGKKTVRITALKAGSAPAGMAGQPGYEKGVEVNYLPVRYNTESKDVREVKDGPNEFDFEVKKK